MGYDFRYKCVLDDCPGAELLFGDTDGFCYCVETDSDIYGDINGGGWCDFSNCVELHTGWDDGERLVPGCFRDEFGGRFLLEFWGLGAKMCSVQPLEGDREATAGGIGGG